MEVHRAEASSYITDCCSSVVRCIDWCSSCGRQQSYSQAFLEEGTEPRTGLATSAPYQAPAQATSSGGSPGTERTALLPKATELHSSSMGRQLGDPTTSKAAKWAATNEEQMTTLSTPKKGGKDALSSKGRNASGLSLAPSEEGEVCSTCLEAYTAENPAIMTKCNHHFHLACIYEWLERKQTCPICEREMSFEEVLE